jgi:hypothetical protein
MAKVEELETRLAKVERDLAELATKVNKIGCAHRVYPFLDADINHAAFEEAIRLGQEYRRSQSFESHG